MNPYHDRASTKVAVYTEEQVQAYNRQFDAKYQWSPQFPSLIGPTSHSHAFSACPGIDKNRPNSELNPMVWEWHTRQI